MEGEGTTDSDDSVEKDSEDNVPIFTIARDAGGAVQVIPEYGDRTSPGGPRAMPPAPVVEIADAPEPSPDDPTGISERTLQGVPLEQLGHVLCQSATGLVPDEAFWAINGVAMTWEEANEQRSWERVIVDHMAVRYVLLALIFRKGGSFELIYQYSSIVNEPGMWAPHTMYSPDGWSAYEKSSCEVTATAAFELPGWFKTRQRAVDVALILKRNMLDDEGVAQARADLLIANRLDHQAIAAQRLEVEKKHGLDDESIARERAAALIDGGLDDAGVAILRARLLKTQGLDAATIEERRQKAYDEAAVEDSHIIRVTGRTLQREGLDDASIAKRRAELLAQHGLA